MYLFDDKVLASKLRNYQLTNCEKISYIIGSFVLYALYDVSAMYIAVEGFERHIAVISIVAILAAMIWMVQTFFERNESADGKDFVERYVIVSFPIAVKILFYVIGFSLLLGFWIGIIGGDPDDLEEGPFLVGFYFVVTLFSVIYTYMRLDVCFKIIHGHEAIEINKDEDIDTDLLEVRK